MNGLQRPDADLSADGFPTKLRAPDLKELQYQDPGNSDEPVWLAKVMAAEAEEDYPQEIRLAAQRQFDAWRLYTSDAADESPEVDVGAGRTIVKTIRY